MIKIEIVNWFQNWTSSAFALEVISYPPKKVAKASWMCSNGAFYSFSQVANETIPLLTYYHLGRNSIRSQSYAQGHPYTLTHYTLTTIMNPHEKVRKDKEKQTQRPSLQWEGGMFASNQNFVTLRREESIRKAAFLFSSGIRYSIYAFGDVLKCLYMMVHLEIKPLG